MSLRLQKQCERERQPLTLGPGLDAGQGQESRLILLGSKDSGLVQAKLYLDISKPTMWSDSHKPAVSLLSGHPVPALSAPTCMTDLPSSS